MEFSWNGVFPALLSPFDKGNKIDVDMLRHSVRFQIESGVNGLIVGGSLGEASTLTKNEKSILTQETIQCASQYTDKGQIPVIVNIAEASTQNAIDAVRQAESDGANGLMVLPPMRYKADTEETIHYFLTVADSTEMPIMIYNNPVDYGIEVTVKMFEKLLTKENIGAVKESTRDTSNILRLKEAFGSRLKILSGVDTLAFESLVLGADGWVAGLVNAFPVETVQIFKLIKDGKIDEAREINSWFFPLLELDITPKLVQNIKLAAARLGLSTPHVRPPRLPLTGKELENVSQIIEDSLSKRPKS